MSGAAIRGVYAITPEIADTEGLLDRVSLALEGGVRVVQYRNKNAPAELKYQQSLALRTLCRSFEVPFIINDDVELAEHVGADGVHLGQADATISEARAMLGVNSIIGISCYNQIALAERALSEGADYVAFGSFFPTANKRDAVAAPLNILREAKGRFRAPVVAIGGIRLENAREVIAAGADALAIISGLFDARDITATARVFGQLFELHVAQPAAF